MKIKTILLASGIILVLVLSILTFIIYNNSQKMIKIDTAMMSNVDSLQQLANLRGFSARIHTIFHEHEPELQNPLINFNRFTAAYDSYASTVKKFSSIINEIENKKSGRSLTEIEEELPILKKTLSSAIQLNNELKQYSINSSETSKPSDKLFEDVFEGTSISLALEKKHYDELAHEMSSLDESNMNILLPFSFISILILLFIIYIIYLRVLNPIQKITKNIEDISLGKFDTEMAGKERDDEIGDLARAFERTVISLKLAMRKAGKEKPKLEEPKKPEEKLKGAFKV